MTGLEIILSIVVVVLVVAFVVACLVVRDLLGIADGVMRAFWK